MQFGDVLPGSNITSWRHRPENRILSVTAHSCSCISRLRAQSCVANACHFAHPTRRIWNNQPLVCAGSPSPESFSLMLTTRIITTDDELAALKTGWNQLAGGEPMCSWNWLATWWKYYRPLKGGGDRLTGRELRLVAVFDGTEHHDSQLIGVAPWYLDRTIVKGNVLRPLGSGEVCTDHQSLICSPPDITRVAAAVAEYLTVTDDEWDRLELPAVDVGDPGIDQLTDELEARECLTTRYAAGNTWIVDLPSSWDDYVESLSHNNRRQVRRVYKRLIESGRSQRHIATCADDFEPVWKVLVDLHQRRRRSLGEPGCFASRAFHDFHHEVALHLLATGQLRMSWIDVDGSPIATEYQFVGSKTNYSYQSGIDPDHMNISPGHLANIFSVRRAIEEGRAHFDFLRGDEPYKSFWLATPRPTFDCVMVPNRRLAKLRGRLTHAATTFKDWVKDGVELVTN
jgi:CelD/BcsL family acetyltransferase involved in cellulose biosynthesis